MKILLILPLSIEHSVSPDIGLGYLATAVRKHGHEPSICHMTAENISHADLADRLRIEQPDAVGLKVFSRDIHSAKQCVNIAKTVLPEVKILLGGPHPSMAKPSDTMRWFDKADFAFMGEAEHGLPVLLNTLTNGTFSNEILTAIPGLIYRNHRTIRANTRSFVKDMDSLGFPAWDLINFDHYSALTFLSPRGRSAPLILTRGCPFDCSFCGNHLITGKQVRRRSISHVISEIEMFISIYSIRNFDIHDDNFTISRSYIYEFCKTILDRNLHINWACVSGGRAELLDRELIRLMEASGCYLFSVGIESGSDRILKHMDKRLSVPVLREKINMIADNSSINIRGYFITGYPEETVEDIHKTINLARELPLAEACFYTFVPVPGTPVYEQLLKNGLIKKDVFQWNKYNMRKVEFALTDISADKLTKLHLLSYFSFYFRPRMFLLYIRHINTWPGIRWAVSMMGMQIIRLFRLFFKNENYPN